MSFSAKKGLFRKRSQPCPMLQRRQDNVSVVDLTASPETRKHYRRANKEKSRPVKRKLEVYDVEDEEIAAKPIGKTVTLDELRKKLCPKEAKVELRRIRFKEILITTTEKGYREVMYVSMKSDSEEDDEESSEDSDDSDCESDLFHPANQSKANEDEEEHPEKQEDAIVINSTTNKYEDYRIQKVRAFSSYSAKPQEDSKEEEDSSKSFYLEIPSSQDFVFCVGYAKDDLHSILEILGGEGMSSMIVDAYMMLRLEKYYKDFESNLTRLREKQLAYENAEKTYSFRKSGTAKREVAPMEQFPTTPTNFQYLSVHFMLVKDRDDPVSEFKPNMEFCPDLSKLGENSDAQLLAPLHASKHLYLAVFDFSKKCVHAYDSSWHYLPMPLREGQIQVILRAITQHHSKGDNNQDPASEWKINFVKTSCPQYDEFSCGIFTMHYAENVLRGLAYYKNGWQLSHKRVMDIRRHIVKTLLSTTSVGRKILGALS